MSESLAHKLDSLSKEELLILAHKVNSLDLKRNDVLGEGPQRLTAYVKPGGLFQMESFEAYLKERLPKHMIPSAVHLVSEIPQLPNGKVDKNALRRQESLNTDKNNQPVEGTSIEKQLIAIWEEVLGFSPIHPSDNFFEIGGDSILSIQIIAKARNAGILLQPNQLFENQTISELALFTEPNKEQFDTVEAVTGPTGLTPIQLWFFEVHKIAPNYWNHMVELTGAGTVEAFEIERITNELVAYHDVLRQCFNYAKNAWESEIRPIEEVPNGFAHFDISKEATRANQEKKIAEILEKDQENCDLAEGPLFRTLYFECGALQSNKVFIVAHHLIVDIVSWNSIFSDFTVALNQLRQNKSIRFKPKTASIKSWASHLKELAASEKVKQELPFWNAQRDEGIKFPCDFDPYPELFHDEDTAVIKHLLNKTDTALFVKKTNQAYNTKSEDLLISALAMTICNWTGTDSFLLGMERHGRSSKLTNMDVSNTIGWFTTYFPLKIVDTSKTNLGAKIMTVKELLRKPKYEGLGYGVLRYLSEDADVRDQLNQNPEILFNHMGTLDTISKEHRIAFVPVSKGTRHLASERTYSMEVNTHIQDGELNINWSFTTKVFKESTVLRLVQNFVKNLNEIIKHCVEKRNTEYTPSDFPEADLSQDDLDTLLNDLDP